MVVSGCVGPRGDGYSADKLMSVEQAKQYHFRQIQRFTEAGADMVTAMTINYVDEAVGIIRAAQDAGMPVVISFTVETDGRLPAGETLQQAIERVDKETGSAVAYFMINCAHPTHFEKQLEADAPWIQRIRGIRANASCKSHAELDESIELDDGDPEELGGQYRMIRQQMRHLSVLGGCCGTDHRHIEAICKCAVSA
jgi:S-methylmethionine-dependent homocysteine/selenocysteine methylase